MVRTLLGAALVLAATFSMASAEAVKGKITRIDGDTISFTTAAPKGEKGEAKTFTAAKDVKVYKMEKKTKLDVADGLKAADLQNIGKKGVAATLDVDGTTVNAITIGGGKKKTE